LLTLDYFELYDDAVAWLESLSTALGPELQQRLGPKDGDSPAYLGNLPVQLAEAVSRPSESGTKTVEQAEVLDTLVGSCRQFLEEKQGQSTLG
jgi:hypothetical protein